MDYSSDKPKNLWQCACCSQDFPNPECFGKHLKESVKCKKKIMVVWEGNNKLPDVKVVEST